MFLEIPQRKYVKLRKYLLISTPPSARTRATDQREKALAKILANLVLREERHWAQRANTTWHQDGDDNTKNFHMSVIINRQAHGITAIKDTAGLWQHEEEAISKVFVEHFHKSFDKSDDDPTSKIFNSFTSRVSALDNIDMIKIPKEEEIKVAAFQIGANKSAGPDGFTGKFFHTYWDTVGQDVTSFIQQFYITTQFTKPLNHTNIVLIPKTKKRSSIVIFRSIGLFPYPTRSSSMVDLAATSAQSESNLIKGISIGHGVPTINHLLYADDLVLFGNNDLNEPSFNGRFQAQRSISIWHQKTATNHNLFGEPHLPQQSYKQVLPPNSSETATKTQIMEGIYPLKR
ncbi:hypothetical protein IFM89_006958 [Coptis chinensis]|uniref:Reverse transcriptase domain-containing protein n=1 Tax=Coptis chinensis TaxID=261450 RepID=A0A835HB23_9MAGN|nr:hypothetical protein IFM89_006958 [Coptis chinensis]